jgi:uncharacterized protein
MAKKAAIIHGSGGSIKRNWFQWLKNELESDGYQTFLPQFKTPEEQSLENWRSQFEYEVGELDNNSLLVGHSIGAVFILRILEKLKSPIHTAVFVAGFTGKIDIEEFDQINASFIAEPYDWLKIKANAKNIICFSGSNDPYVPIIQGQEIADKLNVERIVIEKGGHLNDKAGFRSFPRLIEEIRETI